MNVETFLRQRRDPGTITEEAWRLYCEAGETSTDFEAWASLADGKLVAFCVTALVEDCCNILHQSSADEGLKAYANNALAFEVTKRKLACERVRFVSYGYKSLDQTEGLDHFKLRMGYVLQPFEDRVVVNPALRPMLTLGGARFIRWMATRYPERDLWRKASSVLDSRD